MEITEVKVKKIRIGKNTIIKGLADIVIDDAFAIHNIRIVKLEGNNDYSLSFPSIKKTKNYYKDICHPINQEARDMITKKVVEEFNKIK